MNLTLQQPTRTVLRGVSLDLGAHESIAVLGPSGAGKSTLLQCLAGLRPPTSGQVLVGNLDLYRLSERARASWRLHCAGLVSQRGHLLPELTLAENIALPLELHGRSWRRARRRAAHLVERLGLTESARRRPEQVPGTVRQRAAIARALVVRPAVVFADEPTGTLDSAGGRAVLDLLLRECAEVGALLVLVTHEPSLAARCSRLVRLRNGAVVTP